MERAVREAVETAGHLLHIPAPLHSQRGISGVAVAESHRYTWPGVNLRLSTYSCGDAKPELAVEVYRLKPGQLRVRSCCEDVQGAMETFSEQLYEAQQHLEITEVLFDQRTEHQHLIIFQNPCFGRVLALDGVVQTTEADEFIYHEIMAHVPLLAHGQARRC